MEVLNIALFENRHKWPKFIKECIFPERKNGYDPRDFETFEGLATIKLLNWKQQGVKAINLYLSGLVAATIAVLNAAYSLGIYIKLFHYSTTTNKWLPQTLDFFPLPDGIILKTPEELEVEEEEKRIKQDISDKERRLIARYVSIYTKLRDHYDPNRFTWEDVYSYIIREYTNINKDYVLLMKPYFEKGGNTAESETYNERIRKAIENDRWKRKTITQFPGLRGTWRRHSKYYN